MGVPTFQGLWSALARLMLLARAHGGLLLVLGVALENRIAFLRWWKAFPGGDTYNFILIAQELLRGSYPVAEKRLPVYPALIALASVALDWETAALAVSLAASLAAVALLYAVGRTIGISKTALVVALAPFQAVSPFLFQSVRGYADTTFVALLLGAILGFLRMRTAAAAAFTGALAGLASLTRPEGVLLIPALGALALFRRPRVLALPLVGAALLAFVPFLLLSARVSRPLLPQEYLKDAAVTEFGVTDARTLVANYSALWSSVGFDRIWEEPRRLLHDAITTRPEALPRRAYAFFTDPKEFPSLLLLVGLAFFLWRKRGSFLSVAVPFLCIALPIAWWGVRQRFLVVLYPLPFLVLAKGADALLRSTRQLARSSPRLKFLPAASGLTLLALSLGPWTSHTAAEAREAQEKNWGKDYGYYQAIQEARRLEGRIAFEHRSSIALALFGEPDRGRAVFADTHLNVLNAAEQWDALGTWNVRYVVIRGQTSGAFPVLTDPAFADHFAVLRAFQHPQKRGGPDSATVYAVR